MYPFIIFFDYKFIFILYFRMPLKVPIYQLFEIFLRKKCFFFAELL